MGANSRTMKMGPGRGFSCALGLVLMIKVLAVSAGNDDEPDEYKPAYGEMMEWSRNDYYGMLGIEPNMPHSDLKRYYRRLSLQLHPDKNPNNRTEAHDKFVEVTQGFKVLGNKPRREAYDKFIQQMPSAFRPKYDDKPVMELRTLVLVFIFGISALQYLYWWHRQKQTLERVEGNLRLKQKMDRALRQGKKIVITGAEAPKSRIVSFLRCRSFRSTCLIICGIWVDGLSRTTCWARKWETASLNTGSAVNWAGPKRSTTNGSRNATTTSIRLVARK